MLLKDGAATLGVLIDGVLILGMFTGGETAEVRGPDEPPGAERCMLNERPESETDPRRTPDPEKLDEPGAAIADRLGAMLRGTARLRGVTAARGADAEPDRVTFPERLKPLPLERVMLLGVAAA